MEAEITELRNRVVLLERALEFLRTDMSSQFKVVYDRLSCYHQEQRHLKETQVQGSGHRDKELRHRASDLNPDQSNYEPEFHPDLSKLKKEVNQHNCDCEADENAEETEILPGTHPDFDQRNEQLLLDNSHSSLRATAAAGFGESEDLELEQVEIYTPEVKVEEPSMYWAQNPSEQDTNTTANDSTFLPNFPFPIPTSNLNSSVHHRHIPLIINPLKPEKSFPCEFCGKIFDERGRLNSHLKSHRQTKDFECTFCRKRFKTTGNLRSHVNQVHSDRQPYLCSDCPKSFRNKKNLDYHVRTSHTNERPFPCSFCSYRTAEKSYIRRHVWRRHREEYANFIKL